jgi:hypothetical protein
MPGEKPAYRWKCPLRNLSELSGFRKIDLPLFPSQSVWKSTKKSTFLPTLYYSGT